MRSVVEALGATIWRKYAPFLYTLYPRSPEPPESVEAVQKMSTRAQVTVPVRRPVGIVGAVRFIGRARRSFSTTMRCPRGHVVELYGTFRCPRCKAVREGRAFDSCGICGSWSTHLDCVRCGLAVKDPLL